MKYSLSSVLLLAFVQHASCQMYEYNVACPPPQRLSYPYQNGCTLLMYGGPVVANITINSASQLWFKNLQPQERYEFEVAEAYIVSSGQEEKRIRILTSSEISILVQKQESQTSSGAYIGATEVSESRLYGYEHYPVSRPSGCTSSSYTSAYYTIVPTDELTRVAVYQDDVYIAAFVLEEYDVYTNSTTSGSFDFSTFLIITDAPVAVYSGCACVVIDQDGSYVSSVPPVALYGTQYFAPPVISATALGSYLVRILASEDFTIITTENINEVLNRGGIVETEQYADDTLTISCSKPCLATVHTRSIGSSTEFGNMQFNLVARDRFYTSAVFSTLHYTSRNYVSITVAGEGPYLGLTLDGSSLNGYSWTNKGDYGYLSLSTSQGGHVIQSEELPFAAYAYGHTSYYGGGYGFELRLHGDYVPEPTPTVPTTPEGAEVYEYSAACVPTHHNTNAGYTGCTLIIATDDPLAQVSMTNLDTTWDFDVRQGTPFVMNVDLAYQLVYEVEEKRLKIVSDKPLFVTTSKEDNQYGDRYVESTVWPEKREAGTEFYILQDDATRNGCTSSSYRKVFFAFASYEAATFIEVYDDAEDGLVIAEVLGTYSTYTEYVTSTSTEWTGLRVRATKPIAMVTGTLCIADASSGTYFSTLPPISSYGQEFVVPSIDGPLITAKYAVRILASHDTTVVRKDDVSYALNKGETVIIDYDTILGTSIITCSNNCLAVFFQRSIANNIGHFMMPLVPTDQFYTYRFFSTSEFSITHYVTITVSGLPPMDDVFLDDEHLGNLVWGVRGEFSVTRVQVTTGQHSISSERPFAAYVYGHTLSYGGGYGYSIA